ncbi:MAG: PAS domain S-box protein [Desulfobacterales bacterium]|nr:PAS domain S-box protein [Desulfobacterales bacterium]
MGLSRTLFRRRLAAKLILAVGITLLVSISTWAYFNIKYQRQKMMDSIVASSDRLVNTIRLGTRYAMMLNSRDDINQIIRNIGRQQGIENIRIYNKLGEIKFSNASEGVGSRTNIKDEACYICHRSDPPTQALDLNERIRIISSGAGYRQLGIISPIYNEASCSTGPCHVHPANKKVLGALDLVVSLAGSDSEILSIERSLIGLAVFLFLVTSTIIFLLVLRFVNRPIKQLICGANAIAKGEYDTRVDVRGQDDELGQLAVAIRRMVEKIREHRVELEAKRDEYQRLFNLVPCLITVNDADYRLVAYNREFERTFGPLPGAFCYSAYKGRTERCKVCPVELTFQDGLPHESEEHGVNKDGSPAHWLVKTSPVKDADGKVVAAYEVSLDITEQKILEEQLRQSERKYYAIFNNIPNPVFVLDPNTLEIIDCNENVSVLYGYRNHELIGTSFMALFGKMNEEGDADVLRTSSLMNHVRQFNKEGMPLYIRIRVAATEFSGRQVMLVTTSDVTKQLEAEQQLIQASKMATLGEMATGVAHELNQPLSVIKSASNFFEKKIRNHEPIPEEILLTMSREIDRHVDRASKIINHMREFGRKSDLNLVPVQIGEVMEKAFEIFSQQLKVRGIKVTWELDENLPTIMGDRDRLEQVFINLLINARDAIEEKALTSKENSEKKIILRTGKEEDTVTAEVCDSGSGIAEIMRDKLFEPFFTTKAVGKGTGLGLSISYGIVHDCGGTIEAQSGKTGGACFRLRFPLASGS